MTTFIYMLFIGLMVPITRAVQCKCDGLHDCISDASGGGDPRVFNKCRGHCSAKQHQANGIYKCLYDKNGVSTTLLEQLELKKCIWEKTEFCDPSAVEDAADIFQFRDKRDTGHLHIFQGLTSADIYVQLQEAITCLSNCMRTQLAYDQVDTSLGPLDQCKLDLEYVLRI